MSAIEGTFDVSGFIDAQPVRGRQYAVTVLCGLVMFLDGLDTQSISYAAPLIAKEWTLPHQVLGLIFSSALAGLMVGYLFISPLSDRFGHRRIMIVSTIAFGLFTALNTLSTNVTELLTLRFLTGVGLGATAPSAVALTSEYNPCDFRTSDLLRFLSRIRRRRRHRNLAASVVWMAFTILARGRDAPNHIRLPGDFAPGVVSLPDQARRGAGKGQGGLVPIHSRRADPC
jgi:MFS family permease